MLFLYKIYKDNSYSFRKIELTIGSLLLFISLLLLQWILLEKGNLAGFIVEKLSGFIGIFGVFLLSIFGIILSCLMIFKDKIGFINSNASELYQLVAEQISVYIKNIKKKFRFNKSILNFTKIKQGIQAEKPASQANESIKEKIILNENTKQQGEHMSKKYTIIDSKKTNNLNISLNNLSGKYDQDYQKIQKNNNSIEIIPLEEQFRLNVKHRLSLLQPLNDHIPLTTINTTPPEETWQTNDFKNAADDNFIYPQSKDLESKEEFLDSKDLENYEELNEAQEVKQAKTKKIEVKQDLISPDIQENITTQYLKKEEAKEQEPSQTINIKNTIDDFKYGSSEIKQKNSVVIASEVERNKVLMKDFDTEQIASKKSTINSYELPPLDLLTSPKIAENNINEKEIDTKIQNLLKKLAVFKIEGDITRVYSGPVVTTFEFRPEANVKVNKILSLQDDLAMTLKVKTIRIEAPIPGKDVMGIEIPNNKIETIYLREILESDAFKNANSSLTIALGKDIVGNAFVSNLEKLPHLLVAGTTGSGKSVGMNAIIISLLFKNTPDSLKLIMIDPKKVEFGAYEDIPHLITPVINNPEKAVLALAAATNEMDKRYNKLAQMKSKNIHSYNEKALRDNQEIMPFLVIAIDELADLIMTGGKDVEFSIARIAQMGRACGIHLIVATQRSSTDVVTGLIKTNLPSRISYKVGNRIDSKVILDQFGAERLLGNGDGLFTPPGGGLVRIHAPWISEGEIEEIINFLKSQGAPQYDESFLGEKKSGINASERFDEGDEILEQAKSIILQDNRTSISNLQRRLGIGYNKASLIIEALEEKGFLSAPNNRNERTIL